jgi:hypothetical protein
MHRHHAPGRQDVVEIGEDRLLHLARIGRAGDENDLFREIDRDQRLAAAAVALRVSAERRQVHDRQIGDEIGEFGVRGTNQQVADEQRMPGVFGDDARVDAVGRIGAAVEILDEQILALRGFPEIGVERVELRGGHRAVVVPPHGVFGGGVADDELVLGGAAGVHARLGDDGAAGGQHRLVAAQGFLIELRRLEIVGDMLQAGQAECVDAEPRIENASLLHGFLP